MLAMIDDRSFSEKSQEGIRDVQVNFQTFIERAKHCRMCDVMILVITTALLLAWNGGRLLLFDLYRMRIALDIDCLWDMYVFLTFGHKMLCRS